MVVPILDQWEFHNDIIKVFPKLDATLAELVEWNLSVEDWIDIGNAIVRMVDILHAEVRYIHPDSTPNNIMVKRVDERQGDGIYVTISKGLYRMYFIDVDDSVPLDTDARQLPDDKFIQSVYDALTEFEFIADFVAKIKPKWNELELFSYIVGCMRETSATYKISLDDVYNIVKTQF